MIDERTRIQIAKAVSETINNVMLAYQEEWVTEKELCKRIQFFTPNVLRACKDYLPQTAATYEDGRGIHETRRVYGLHAIQQMILKGDLDFTKKDRVVYRPSKGRKNVKNGNNKK